MTQQRKQKFGNDQNPTKLSSLVGELYHNYACLQKNPLRKNLYS